LGEDRKGAKGGDGKDDRRETNAAGENGRVHVCLLRAAGVLAGGKIISPIGIRGMKGP
jgi:hypothetical protein